METNKDMETIGEERFNKIKTVGDLVEEMNKERMNQVNFHLEALSTSVNGFTSILIEDLETLPQDMTIKECMKEMEGHRMIYWSDPRGKIQLQDIKVG